MTQPEPTLLEFEEELEAALGLIDRVGVAPAHSYYGTEADRQLEDARVKLNDAVDLSDPVRQRILARTESFLLRLMAQARSVTATAELVFEAVRQTAPFRTTSDAGFEPRVIVERLERTLSAAARKIESLNPPVRRFESDQRFAIDWAVGGAAGWAGQTPVPIGELFWDAARFTGGFTPDAAPFVSQTLVLMLHEGRITLPRLAVEAASPEQTVLRLIPRGQPGPAQRSDRFEPDALLEAQIAEATPPLARRIDEASYLSVFFTNYQDNDVSFFPTIATEVSDAKKFSDSIGRVVSHLTASHDLPEPLALYGVESVMYYQNIGKLENLLWPRAATSSHRPDRLWAKIGHPPKPDHPTTGPRTIPH